MTFDRSKEPSFQTKVRVTKNTCLYDASGAKQTDTLNAGSTVTVFEVKEINNQIYYRVGGQTRWLPKSVTDWGIKESSGSHNDNRNDYNVAIKDGLVIAKNSEPPTDKKDLIKLFKHGNTFPDGTEFQWIAPPDTSQNKYTNAKIKIIFPDGTTKEHSVHYNITAGRSSTPTAMPIKNTNESTESVDLKLGDLNFSFVKQYRMLHSVEKSVNEAILLYKQTLYKQLSNTIRQGLEIIADKLLTLNNINLDDEWKRANLSNKLGYIAYLRILPQKIMDVCFSIKNYGNIGSHHNKEANFNKASALTDLQQYHDLLIYLVNTYVNAHLTYTDVQISDDQNKHPNWYKRKGVVPDKFVTFAQYMYQRTEPKKPAVSVQPVNVTPVEPVKTPEPAKPKMGKGMNWLLRFFILLGVVIIAGIGYEVYQLSTGSNQSVQTSKPVSIKEEARNLTTKQDIALSLLYAKEKYADQWQDAYDTFVQNNYNVYRYDEYSFGDATVTAQGHNYIYVINKNIGLGFRDKGNGNRLVTFFNATDTENDSSVSAYTYQMLKEIKQSNQETRMKKLAKKIIFSDPISD